MLTSVNGTTQASEWYASSLATGTTSSSGANTFEEQLLSVIVESLEKAAEDIGASETKTTPAASQNETAESAKSQILATYSRSVDGESSVASTEEVAANASAVAETAVEATQAASSNTTAEETTTSTEPEVLTRLKAALEAAGHDPADYNLVYEDQTVWYPGGNYQNRIITATFADGYQESYGADLTEESPNATVMSIEHTLRDIAAETYS